MVFPLKKWKSSIFVLCILVLTIGTVSLCITPAVATTNPKVVIDLSHNQGPADGNWTGNKLEALMANFEGNLTLKGYDVIWATEINESVLADVQFLFLGSVYGNESQITDTELAVIVNWFSQGQKTIWVSGDSDYGDSLFGITNANKVLRAIGSKVRVEGTSIEDPITNCGAAYRPRANVTNSVDEEVANIVAGVNETNGVLFHGPAPLYGFINGAPVALETATIPNVYWVMASGASSIIVDNDLVLPEVHEVSEEGSYAVMAVEKFAGPTGDCKIIVSGENPYGGYQPMFTSDYYDVALDGASLVMNAFDWGAEIEDASVAMTTEIDELISTQANEISALQSEVAGLQSLLYAAIGIAVIGVIVGIVSFVKK